MSFYGTAVGRTEVSLVPTLVANPGSPIVTQENLTRIESTEVRCVLVGYGTLLIFCSENSRVGGSAGA
jgi:hypothetical protein